MQLKEYRHGKHVTFKYAIGKTDIYDWTSHDYYVIYFLLNGKVEFISNNVRHSLKPFELMVIPPKVAHQFTVKIEPYERCALHIYPPFLEDLQQNTFFSATRILSLHADDRIVKNFLYLIDCLYTIQNIDFLHILPAVTTDILFLIKYNEQTEKQPESLRTLSLRVMHYLNEHLTSPLNLNALSSMFYCSVSSLCHLFKRAFGMSIKSYIQQKRLILASEALQKGEQSEKVSARYGFTNYSTFYRAYKKHFGYAPSQTKKRRKM